MADQITKLEIRAIEIQLENLKKTVEDGFKNVEAGFRGVYERQDKTNGKVTKNTEHRIASEAVTRNFKWFAAFLGSSNIGTLIYFLIQK